MATRVPLQPENQLVRELTRLRSDVDGLKAVQKVGGANVLGFFAASPSSYDYSITIAANTSMSYLLQFTGRSVTYAPFIDMQMNYAVTTNVLADAVPPYANGATVRMIVQDLPLSGQVSQWYISFFNDSSSSETIYLKPIFNCSSLGSFQLFHLSV